MIHPADLLLTASWRDPLSPDDHRSSKMSSENMMYSAVTFLMDLFGHSVNSQSVLEWFNANSQAVLRPMKRSLFVGINWLKTQTPVTAKVL